MFRNSSIDPRHIPEECQPTWIPRDAQTGDALTTGPVPLDEAVSIQKADSLRVRLDTINGGGSGSWTYPMDDTTELCHRIIQRNQSPAHSLTHT